MHKKTTLIAVALLAAVFLAGISNTAYTNLTGAPNARTGSPGDNNNTCAISGCHTGFPVTVKEGIITSNVPDSGYTPGTTYTITASSNSAPNRTIFGFQISPQNATGTLLGSMSVTNAAQTKLTGGNKYITHTANGRTGANGQKSWSFNWTAPASGTGDVTFYGCFNNANGNGVSTGDSIIRSTLVLQEKTITGIHKNELSALGFVLYPLPASTELNIKNNHRVYVSAVQVFDLNGRLIMNKETETDGAVKLDLSALHKGHYLINLSNSEKSIATARFIKE